jgi:hypothetical protein
MPFNKVLTRAQREVLINVVNDHVNAQAAIAAIMAKPAEETPESIRVVVEAAARRAMMQLNQYVDGITEEAPVEPVPLESALDPSEGGHAD